MINCKNDKKVRPKILRQIEFLTGGKAFDTNGMEGGFTA